MSLPPKRPLDYESRRKEPSHGVQAACGVIAGGILSAIAWSLVFGPGRGNGVMAALVSLLAVKLAGGWLLMSRQRARYFGIGLIISIALGGLIFFGICAANFKELMLVVEKLEAAPYVSPPQLYAP